MSSPTTGPVSPSVARETPPPEELFELSAELESDLLRRAVPLLSDHHIERAEEVPDEYDAAFRDRDIAAWGDLNWQFHSTRYSAASRPVTLTSDNANCSSRATHFLEPLLMTDA